MALATKRTNFPRIVLDYNGSIRIGRQFFRSKPILREIFPSWIRRLDKFHSSLPSPMLDLFLASDCAANVLPGLEINKAMDLVFLREARNASRLVLEYATAQSIGDSCVDE